MPNQSGYPWQQESTPEKLENTIPTCLNVQGCAMLGLANQGDLQELRYVMEMNREQVQIISHCQNKLVSIVNITRLEMIKNRETINHSNVMHELENWIIKIDREANNKINAINLYQMQCFKKTFWKVQENKHFIQNVRMDLEISKLAEELHPLGDLEKLSMSLLTY